MKKAAANKPAKEENADFSTKYLTGDFEKWKTTLEWRGDIHSDRQLWRQGEDAVRCGSLPSQVHRGDSQTPNQCYGVECFWLPQGLKTCCASQKCYFEQREVLWAGCWPPKWLFYYMQTRSFSIRWCLSPHCQTSGWSGWVWTTSGTGQGTVLIWTPLKTYGLLSNSF